MTTPRTGVTESLPAVRMGGDDAGFTLAEVLIVVALLLVVTAIGATSLAANTGRQRASALALASELGEARSLAGITGNGATLFVVPAGSASMVAVYAGRPSPSGSGLALDRSNPALLLPTAIALSIDGSAFLSTFALFVSSSGSVSALGNYTVREAQQDPLPAEPRCDASIPTYLRIAVAYGTPQVTSSDLPCTFARPNLGQP